MMSDMLDLLSAALPNSQELRYGENPHQRAWWLPADPEHPGPLGGKLLQTGKKLGYVNMLDMDAAYRVANMFRDSSICIVKHASPCGIASAKTLEAAYLAAYECDKMSAYGGVIGTNQIVDAATAAAISKLFVECIAAPGFDDEALRILGAKKDLRLLEVPKPTIDIDSKDLRLLLVPTLPGFEVRSVLGGLLIQEIDRGDAGETRWEVVSDRMPTDAEWPSLNFAWQACQRVLSNAIVLVQGTQTVGIGGGQPNRIDCVKMAVARAGEKAKGSVLASDAFFPFRDSVDAAAAAGVTAIVFPGGSKRDQEAIAAADAADMAVIMTGVRHFRH